MRRIVGGLLLVVAVVAFVAVPSAASAARPAPASASAYTVRPVCPPSPSSGVRCHALELVPRPGASVAATAGCDPPLAREGCDGLRPQDLHSAYDLPAEAPTPQTIAIVAVGDDPSAWRDLSVYDTEFSLPPCTRGNHCLTKLDGAGLSEPLPPASPEAAVESSIDLQVAHGVCPNCKLVLVEAETNSLASLEEAEETAARLPGVTEISNSWGELEPSRPPREGAAFDHPGIVVTAAAGDTGYDDWGADEQRGAEYPASSPDVIAVGGTQLTLGEGGEWSSETPWAAQTRLPSEAGGSACSGFFGAPAWQRSLPDWSAIGCGGMRAVADVAAVGDPLTGVAVYDSTKNEKGIKPQWQRLGGTSVGAPLIAAAFALAGGANGVAYPAATLYEDAARLPGTVHDIATGSNGECRQIPAEACTTEEEAASCSSAGICLAGPGYDGPTGVGSLDGIGALLPLPPLRRQQIEFTTTPPAEPTVDGTPYAIAATAGSGLPVTLVSRTPEVCALQGGAVSFLSPGACTIAAEQPGNSEWEAAPLVTQTFTVDPAPGSKTGTGGEEQGSGGQHEGGEVLSFASSLAPGPVASSRFGLAVARRGSAIVLTVSPVDAGSLRWLLTFPNGSFGVLEGAVRGCGAGTRRLRGGCRPASALFAEGGAKLAGGRAVLTLRPTPAGALALRRARSRGRRLQLTVLVRFTSSLGGAPSTQQLTLRLGR